MFFFILLLVLTALNIMIVHYFIIKQLALLDILAKTTNIQQNQCRNDSFVKFRPLSYVDWRRHAGL